MSLLSYPIPSRYLYLVVVALSADSLVSPSPLTFSPFNSIISFRTHRWWWSAKTASEYGGQNSAQLIIRSSATFRNQRFSSSRSWSSGFPKFWVGADGLQIYPRQEQHEVLHRLKYIKLKRQQSDSAGLPWVPKVP